MPAIAVLDDRRDPRDSMVRAINAMLPEQWECVICPLFDSTTDYADWLWANDVRVLVADQVLNEAKPDTIRTVHYKGDQVTRAIRKSIPNLPIYIVTAYPEDSDLISHTADVEDIVKRRDLVKNARTYVNRMLRAAQRYDDEQTRQATRLSELAAKVASGQASKQEEKELATLQTLLSTPASVDVDKTRAQIIARTEALLKEMEKLKSAIEKRGKRSSR